ncbi:SpaA isopeptide-forming pilin-related protein [Bifidobacterium tsurumiense]|uniref:SpaA isopeptide-forming pilin-related protein n=1 Tax=Bifidobacterium tsurumiense TaxID=356829 RepID=UPI0012B36619|nr:SpaA isopeptide-forming pilin-related protein [Bifidobacterium tsurumiense]MSS12897.1 hypothetical protein [Bifidobacterium tsurumiense]
MLWNFYDANVSIRGGIALEGNDAGGDGKVSYDDPSAAMLGSIVVRTGDFDDHVTTNGRVYVNGDFMMNNPTAAKNTRFNEGATASVIDMDQERHNFPWNGQASSECSTISWQKVSSDDTTQLLPGSEWGIYTAQEDAQNATNALLIITDKSNNYGSGAGVFQTQNLAPNATYYLKELKAPDGYVKSDTIYTVVTSHTGDTTNTVPVGAAGVVEDGKISNTPEGGSFSWSKAADGTNTLLDGSSWTLTKVDTKESWIVDDSSTKVARVDIQDVRGRAIEEATIEQYSTVQLKAQVFADDNSAISQDVTWKSSDGSVASVSSDGLVTAIGSGSTVISACSVASRNTVCDTVLVTVNAKPANSLTVSRQGDTQAWSGTLELNAGDSADFTAVVDPSDIAVSWVSANADIATVNASGHIVGVAEGQTTITAIAGDKQVSIAVVVSDTRFTTVYFKGDTLRAWMADSHISGAFTAADVVVRYSATNSGRDAWKQWPQSASLQEFCSDEWYSVKVPTEQKRMNVVLYNGQDVNNKSNYYMGSNGTTPFIVGAGVKNYTITDYQTYGTGVPTCSTSTARVVAYRTSGNQLNEQMNGNSIHSSETAPSNSRTVMGMTSSAAFISSTSSENAGISSVQLISEKAMAGAAGCDADGHLCDNDSRLGIISVSKMADGTYILKEKEPPSGYTISQYVYRVVITSGKVVEWGWAESDDGPFKQCADDGTSICRTVTVSEDVGIIGRIYNQSTTAQWKKTDSTTASALAGSSWRIANAGDDNTVAGSNVWCVRDNADSGSAVNNCNAKGKGTILADADSAEGSIGVRSLPAGDYTLTEADAPLGYVLDGTTYTLTVGVDGSSEVKRTDDSSPVTDSTIANDESRGSATWKKVDAQNTGKVLGGSSWTVRYTRTIGSQTVNKVYVARDNESSDAGKPYACTPSEPDADHAEGVLCDTNARAGYFLIDNLEWGTYTLEERSAPQGYELNDKDKPSKSIGVIDGTFQRDIDLGTIADSQKNYFLPNTGRWGGVVTFVILGLIALLAGAAVVQRNRLPQSPQQLQ